MTTKQTHTVAMTDEELDAAVGGLIAVVIITAYRNSEVGFQGCVPTAPCYWSPDRYGVSSRKHETSVKPNVQLHRIR